MSRLGRIRRRFDPRRLRLGERPINAETPPREPASPKPADTGPATPEPATAEAPKAPATAATVKTPAPAAKATEPPPTTSTRAPEKPAPAGRRRLLGLPVPIAALLGILVAIGAVAGIFAAAGVFDTEGDEAAAPAPTASAPTPPEPSRPTAARPEPDAGEQAAEEIGFPAFATKNTTRVGGSDPAANAAGIALATYPSAGGVEPPVAVTLVSEEDWRGGVAAAVLMAEPVRAPILISGRDSVPSVTAGALEALAPEGSVQTDGAQVFAVGDVAVPGGFEVRRIGGGNAVTTAAAIEKFHDRLVAGPPDHIVVTTSAKPEFAAPAAAWAARSGDPVLYAAKDRLPKATVEALRRHKKVPVYVLGPSSAISSNVVRRINEAGGRVRRVAGEDPVSNAVDFARYADGTFGWNINDPGHGFVVARAGRPLDAVAAAPLSGSGTWGPLLLTDSAGTVPGALRGFLLDVKPGYRTDPTRALYNHIWVIGDQEAIGVSQQAALDDLAELARIPSAEPEREKRPTDAGGGRGNDQ